MKIATWAALSDRGGPRADEFTIVFVRGWV